MNRVAYFAHRYGIPLGLARALIGDESGGRAGAVSPKGATGLTQVLPSTAAGMYGISAAEASRRLKNPEFALDAGFRYLRHQFDAFGSWRLALAAYNAGPNAVHEFHGVPPYAETQHYVRDILSKAGVVSSATGPASTGLDLSLGGEVAAAGPTKRDVAMEGLQALASGHYSPQVGLEALKHVGELPMGPGSSLQFNIQGKVTQSAKKAVSLAEEYIGTPYVWGGESPKGFDCSGLLQYVWGKSGVQIPRTTYEQWQAGRQVGRGQLRYGDAVFFRGSDARGNLPGHVGIYIGGGRFIESPHSGSTVHISRLAGRRDYVGARRYA
jgi:hypothetical protein